MWQYIKENNLQDPKNKQFIKCDEKLSKVSQLLEFSQYSFAVSILQVIPTKKFRGFGMAKYLKDHMNVEWEEAQENKMQKLFNLLSNHEKTVFWWNLSVMYLNSEYFKKLSWRGIS